MFIPENPDNCMMIATFIKFDKWQWYTHHYSLPEILKLMYIDDMVLLAPKQLVIVIGLWWLPLKSSIDHNDEKIKKMWNSITVFH